MAKKRPMIPVHRVTGSVPHIWELKEWPNGAAPNGETAEQIVDAWKAELAAGYDASPRKQFKSEEDWLRWLTWMIEKNDYEMKDTWIFEDTLKITSYGRGRSAAYFELKSTTTSMEAVMMMSDMSHMVQAGVINKGVITGRWTFGKKGKNYGIEYVGEA